jgi:hypothetical protein
MKTGPYLMDEAHAMNIKPFALRATQNVRGGGGGCTKLNKNKVKTRITSKKWFRKVFEKMNNNNQ